MVLLQEFNIEIRDKKGAKNSVEDHLSRIERESDPMPIRDEFPDEQLLHINTSTPWKIKITLQKMANPSRKDWSRLLEDALWAHRTAY
ncbi:hypothetical protein CR513_36588, partial [Mucuna pruriens]